MVLGLFGLKVAKEKIKTDLAKPVIVPSPTLTTKRTEEKVDVKSLKVTRSLFVPYWAVKKGKMDTGDFSEFIYFGVAPGKDGVDEKETGALRLKNFLSSVPDGHEKFLVLRMINPESNFAILKDPASQRKLIQDTISLAKENGFKGIILDLELNALPFESIIGQINSFTSVFYKEVKNKNLTFSQTFYGDTFYRLRPFDVKALSQNADKFYLMAYDFHKAKANPGPNFPLHGRETYGYDMTKMADDFLQFIPSQKITVVFGLFGYDWTVDNKGNGVSVAKPLTNHEIQKQFLTDCQPRVPPIKSGFNRGQFKSCTIKRDTTSSETQIHYTDTDSKNHIVWFENMESVSTKQRYLKEKGITSFSYWAYSYF